VSSVRVESLGRLDPDEVGRVALLVERATEADGVRPLSEHVALHLRHGGDAHVRNVLVYADGALAAYAHLDVTDPVEGSSAELVVDPAHRGAGVGGRLVTELLRETPDGRLRLWAHGEHPAAARLAAHHGFDRVRILWQLRRSLYAPIPAAALPDGIGLRAFIPGADDDEWVALNARAFAGHPEQGGWTLRDLRLRMAEPWFDPAGFLIAEEAAPGGGRRMVGFHWTKVHGGERDEHGHALTDQSPAHGPHAAGGWPQGRHDHDGHGPHGHDPLGEVYVVGVDPALRGRGLGRALVLAGLRHLRAAGLPAVLLYVDADNTSAVALYESLGFTRWDTDVLFRRG
jgi:mycothiol synthase